MHQVGDTVYGSFGRYSTIDVRDGVVVKITPTGRINVDFGLTFVNGANRIFQFKGDMQVGGDKWHPVVLISEARYVDLKARSEVQQVLEDFRKRCNYPPSFTNKSDILKFVEELRTLADKIPDTWTKGV